MSYRTPNIGALTQLLLRAVGVGTPNGANPLSVAKFGAQTSMSLLPNLARALPTTDPAQQFVATYDPSLSYAEMARQNGAPAFGQNAAGAFDQLQQGAFLAALSPGFRPPEINYTSPVPVGTIQTTLSPGVGGEQIMRVKDPATGEPLYGFRVENAQGTGPIAQRIQSANRGAESSPYINEGGKYFSGGPRYVRGFAKNAAPNTRVVETQFAAKPSEVMDLRSRFGLPASLKNGLVQSAQAELSARASSLPEAQKGYMQNLIKQYESGSVEEPLKFIQLLDRTSPGFAAAMRQRMGIKLTIQNADEGGNVMEAPEIIVHDPSVLRPLNTVTPQEFLQLFNKPFGR